jgi:hypothetical protein
LHTLEQIQQDGLKVEITSTQLIISTHREELAPKYGPKKELLKTGSRESGPQPAAQRELSEKSGVHLASIHEFEAGHNIPCCRNTSLL